MIARKIPLTLLTGFLGSGKTTLLREILTQPDWRDTLVLVNELGAVGLDHHLLGSASDAVMLMENGCVCCSVRDDLVGVLEDLFWKRLQRQMPRFTRVVVETTGLADPGPIIGAFLSHTLVAERYALQGVLCTVDAMGGAAQFAQQPEALAQAAAADALLLTKTDVADAAQCEALEAALHALNPLAMQQRVVQGRLSPEMLLALDGLTRHRNAVEVSHVFVTDGPTQASAGSARYLHHGRVSTTTLRFTQPWQWDEFELALRSTLAAHGAHILRIKGWLALAGEPGPTIVQAVRQTLFPIEKLDAWPDGKRESFVVCITTGLKAGVVEAAFRGHMRGD